MGDPVKVLYLMPQGQPPASLAAYSFLDEELFALQRSGVEAHFLATRGAAAGVARDVQVDVTRQGRGLARAGALGFWLRSASHVPAGAYRDGGRLANGITIEHEAARVVRRRGLALVHSHFGWPQGFGGMLAARAAGVPLVASLRGTDILRDEAIGYGKRAAPFFDATIRRLLAFATRTLYFSRFMRDRGIELGAPAERTRVIRKGVDLAHFGPVDDRPALRARLGLSPDLPMVLSVGGLIPRKGIDTTLHALAQLPGDAWQFVVCGDGEERDALRALAADLGLADRARFVGRVPRDTIQQYFAACDVFVLASAVEAAGNVLFEAMASARPVVCTDAGGPGEYVEHGRTGIVVPVGDRDALARAVASLLRDPALGDRLGHEGRRVATTEFTYGRMIEDIKAVYQELA